MTDDSRRGIGTRDGAAIRPKEVVVTGSLAYDFIMDFPGDFRDHIMPDKVHVLSISFLVEKMKKQRGGVAGNIAYSLALLQQPCSILATAGADDFDTYRAFLEQIGVDTTAVIGVPEEMTASCFITADTKNNTVMGFYAGAMARSDLTSFHNLDGGGIKVALIGPTVPEAIERFPKECRMLGIPFVYMPAWQTTIMDGSALADGLKGATAFLGSDYEFAAMSEKTGLSEDAMLHELASNGALVKTLGGEGSLIRTREAIYAIPIAPAREVVDPTGGGDAYCAGLLTGIVRGWDWAVTGRIAAQAATYAIELYGPQAHTYTWAEFAARYQKSFNEVLSAECSVLSGTR
ncbi:MAG: carbohydrate kinase family protein [Thermomicrobiales bacterium]